MTPQRGAIPLELDGRTRTLFFPASATFLLVERYGFGFAAALYTPEGTAPNITIRLKSGEALTYFLWAALQSEAAEDRETLTLEYVGSLIRPWNIAAVLRAVMQALTGANYVPPVKAGNAPAAETPAPPAAQTKAAKKPSRKPAPKIKRATLKTPSGLRLQR